MRNATSLEIFANFFFLEYDFSGYKHNRNTLKWTDRVENIKLCEFC